MDILSGHLLQELPYSSPQTRIYRGIRLLDGLPIIIKILNQPHPSAERRARFEEELLIGAQPAVIELPPVQAQNRFNHEFRKFVAVFATTEHPLVIFIDDLQWADLPSLELLPLLLPTPALPHLLLIGAYRDSEVTPGHALNMALGEMQKHGAALHTVALAPLGFGDVNQLLVPLDAQYKYAGRPLNQTEQEPSPAMFNPTWIIQQLRPTVTAPSGSIADMNWQAWRTRFPVTVSPLNKRSGCQMLPYCGFCRKEYRD